MKTRLVRYWSSATKRIEEFDSIPIEPSNHLQHTIESAFSDPNISALVLVFADGSTGMFKVEPNG